MAEKNMDDIQEGLGVQRTQRFDRKTEERKERERLRKRRGTYGEPKPRITGRILEPGQEEGKKQADKRPQTGYSGYPSDFKPADLPEGFQYSYGRKDDAITPEKMQAVLMNAPPGTTEEQAKYIIRNPPVRSGQEKLEDYQGGILRRPNPPPTYYRAKKGDTLESIAADLNKQRGQTAKDGKGITPELLWAMHYFGADSYTMGELGGPPPADRAFNDEIFDRGDPYVPAGTLPKREIKEGEYLDLSAIVSAEGQQPPVGHYLGEDRKPGPAGGASAWQDADHDDYSSRRYPEIWWDTEKYK